MVRSGSDQESESEVNILLQELYMSVYKFRCASGFVSRTTERPCHTEENQPDLLYIPSFSFDRSLVVGSSIGSEKNIPLIPTQSREQMLIAFSSI